MVTKKPSDVPEAPGPLSATPRDGTEAGRALARRYLVNAVRLLASVAFSPESEAPLHSKVIATKELVAIAGAGPQGIPAPPAPQGDGDGEPS